MEYRILTPELLKPSIMRVHHREGALGHIIKYSKSEIVTTFLDPAEPHTFGVAIVQAGSREVIALAYGAFEPGSTLDRDATFCRAGIVEDREMFEQRIARKEPTTILLFPEKTALIDSAKIGRDELSFVRRETMLVRPLYRNGYKENSSKKTYHFGLAIQLAFEGLVKAALEHGAFRNIRCLSYGEVSPDALQTLMHAFKYRGIIVAGEHFYEEGQGISHRYVIFAKPLGEPGGDPTTPMVVADREEALTRLSQRAGIIFPDEILQIAEDKGYVTREFRPRYHRLVAADERP